MAVPKSRSSILGVSSRPPRIKKVDNRGPVPKLPPGAPSGPPRILKPTYELLGEVYLQADKPIQAQEQFAISLQRHRNRIRSLVGAARAARASGDKSTAKETYERLLSQLKNADLGVPELAEAKKYLNE